MSDISAPQIVTTESATDGSVEVPSPAMRVKVPDYVVFRAFASETVVLNINTGQYHGLNPVAGRMFETLQRTLDLQMAAHELAQEFEQSAELIKNDLRIFCDDLVGRGLLEIYVASAP